MIFWFVENEINFYVDDWEKEESWLVYEVLKKMGDLGLFGFCYLECFGGVGFDFFYFFVLSEEFGVIYCGVVLMVIGVYIDMCMLVLVCYGFDELWDEYLILVIVGEMVGCIGVFEFGGGLDVVVFKIVVKFDGDDYIVLGMKMWIINGL